MILATVPMAGAIAAGMDRSGQSIAAFLQPGNYFEAGISVLNASVLYWAIYAFGCKDHRLKTQVIWQMIIISQQQR